MTNTTENKNIKVEFRLQNVSLTDERKQFLRENLGAIPNLIAQFSVRELHVDVHKHPHKGDYHIKMSLRLLNETLFTGERDMDLMAAWRRCTSQMSSNVKAFKEKLSRKHLRGKEFEPAEPAEETV